MVGKEVTGQNALVIFLLLKGDDMRTFIICMMMGLSTMLWAGQTADYLAQMSYSERENAIIDLETNGAPTVEMTNAQDLWNQGHYGEAINAIAAIEENTGDLILGISWREPKAVEDQRWADDVLVTDPADDLRGIELIYAGDTGNLFVIGRGTDGSVYWWWVYMSTDGGSTWAETYSWGNVSQALVDVDAAEMPGYVYVAYCGFDPVTTDTAARIRRVFSNNGQADGGFGYHIAFTDPDGLNEIELEPNRVSQTQLYYTALESTGRVLYYFSNDGIGWSGVTTNITNAERQLDMDYGFITGGNGNLFWLSYISPADSICAATRVSGTFQQHTNLGPVNTMSYSPTAVAHHGDSVLVFYETPGFSLRYAITYNAGNTWAYGGTSITTDSCNSMDVTGRGNEGWHLSYATYEGSGPEVVHYSHRSYPSGAWDSPTALGDQDEWIQYQTSIDFLGAPGAYGVAYIDDAYDVYFDRKDWQTGVAEYKTKPSTHFLTLAPNPSRDFATLSYTIPTPGHVRITLHDVVGRNVETIVDETRPAGTYMTTLNNQNLSAGVYFIYIETDGSVSTKKMTIIR